MAKTGNFTPSQLTLAEKTEYYKYMMGYPGATDPSKDIEVR